MKFSRYLFAVAAAMAVFPVAHAWDYEGHRLVHGVALAALPKEFPGFVREAANAERIQFLAGEADRWRNVPDLPLSHGAGMEHYIDLEDIPMAGLDPHKLSPFRYTFAVEYAAGREANIDKFKPFDPAKNRDRTREWPGFAPWAITEAFAKLRSAFSYLRVYEELGTEEEIANAKANIIYLMGQMGHYVGDCAQPLHTTMHHHGWVGDNPHGYTTWYGFHSWIDGGFIAKAGIKLPDLLPQVETALAIPLAPRPDGRDPIFVAVMDYILEQHAQVEPLYQLEKAGKMGRDQLVDREGKIIQENQPVTPEARAFITRQLVTGGEMLAAIWVTAWRNSTKDTFLINLLTKRKAAAAGTTSGGSSPLTPRTAPVSPVPVM